MSPWGAFAIDETDRTPLHAQVERGILSAIATGRLAVGAQLPTVRQLAVDLKVNANTIAKVYAHLERTGVLETRRGVGSFVSTAPGAARSAAEHTRRLRAFVTRLLADAAAAGFNHDEILAELADRK